MRLSLRTRSGLAFLVLLLPGLCLANSNLEKAIDLYDQQRYQDAHAALQKVDREQLPSAQQREYEQMLRLVPRALEGVEQARRDLQAARNAANGGNRSKAVTLFNKVIENDYAPAALRNDAITERSKAQQRPRPAASRQSGGGGGGAMPMHPVNTSAARPAERPPARPMPKAPQQTSAASGNVRPAAAVTVSDTAVNEMQQRDSLLWQRAVAKMQELAGQARSAASNNEYDQAIELAEQALQIIEGNRIYAEPVSRYETAREAATSLRTELLEQKGLYEQQMAEKERLEIQGRVLARKRILEQQRREKVEQLFNTASQLRKERRFEEATEIYRQILFIDPSDVAARHFLEISEDYASVIRQEQWHDNYGRESRAALTSAENALIPWDYDVLYPRNWLELTSRRDVLGAGVTGQNIEDIELNRKLDETLPQILFQEQPFEQVVDFLQEITEVNLSVDWEDLEANGIERDKAISLNLSNLKFRTVLDTVLDQIGGDVQLAFSVGDSLLRVATKEKLDRDKFVLVYDIRDLLVNVPRFTNAAQLDPGQALQAVAQQGGGGLGGGGGGFGGGGGGGGGQNLFQNTNQNNNEDNFDTAGLVERIMDVIRETVEPDSWRESGGGDASLRELNGQLIIYNTSDAHRQVQDLLSQLRETRALQIALESRFLSVTSNFLEEIGVDIDFVFNSGSAGFDRAFTGGGSPATIVDPFTGAAVLIPRQFSQIGSFASAPGFGTPFAAGTTPAQPFQQAAFVPGGTGVSPHFNDLTPITAQQSSLALTNPANYNTTVPGSFATQAALQPALNIAGSFLDNLQVDFLIRATQANSRSSIVQAPRLLLFNGQRSNITVGRARQYVAGLNPVLAEGAVGFQPVTNAAQSGATLDVEATISADRKYVTVTVQTQQSEEPSFERFEVQRASGNSPGAFLTLLDQRFVTINTTASIPDGGTILLGGLKQVGEVEVEAGVPILSKIPILKRAFTNSTIIKDTRTLLILMKAKILIQKEAEEEAFPTFSGSVN